MASERYSLADLALKVIDNRGKTCPVGDQGIPLIATNCIREESLYPTYETNRFVSDQTYASWFRGHPAPGDLIFVTKASPGRVCMAPDPVDFCIAQDMVAIRPDPSKVYPKFLFALLRSNTTKEQISNMHVGTMIPHFKKGDFDKLFFELPDHGYQEYIGDLYFDLSRKIHLLRETNATLEAIAQAIFKSWFVDFDPVRAKAEGRDPEGVPPEVADLFPSEFEDSELGAIPKGWSVTPFTGAIDVIGGGTPKTSVEAYWNGDVPWFSVVDAPRDGDVFVLDTEKHITAEGVANSSTRILRPGTTIISARGTVGKTALVGREMAMNQSCYGLQGRRIGDALTYFATRRLVVDLRQRSHGSVFETITRDTLASVAVVVGLSKISEAFEDLVGTLLARVKNNVSEARALESLRDTLLPRLMSGKLHISEEEA